MSNEPKPKKPRSPKQTDAVVAKRVDEIYAIRIDGAQFHEIREYAAKMGWGVGDSQLRKYIEKANKLLKERRERSRGTLFALHLARRESIYARAIATADLRTALAALQDSAKLDGLYPDNRGLEKQIAQLLRRLSGLEETTDEPETPCPRH